MLWEWLVLCPKVQFLWSSPKLYQTLMTLYCDLEDFPPGFNLAQACDWDPELNTLLFFWVFTSSPSLFFFSQYIYIYILYFLLRACMRVQIQLSRAPKTIAWSPFGKDVPCLYIYVWAKFWTHTHIYMYIFHFSFLSFNLHSPALHCIACLPFLKALIWSPKTGSCVPSHEALLYAYPLLCPFTFPTKITYLFP